MYTIVKTIQYKVRSCCLLICTWSFVYAIRWEIVIGLIDSTGSKHFMWVQSNQAAGLSLQHDPMHRNLELVVLDACEKSRNLAWITRVIANMRIAADCSSPNAATWSVVFAQVQGSMRCISQRRRRGMPASACCIFPFFPIHARALLASQRCRNWFKEVATTNAEVLLCVILPISTKPQLVPVLLVLLMYRNEVSRVSIWSSTAVVLLLAGINKVRDYHHWWAGHRFRAWIVKSLSGLFTGSTKEKESTCEYVDGS